MARCSRILYGTYTSFRLRGFPLYFDMVCLDDRIGEELSFVTLCHDDRSTYYVSDTKASWRPYNGSIDYPLSTVGEFVNRLIVNITKK